MERGASKRQPGCELILITFHQQALNCSDATRGYGLGSTHASRSSKPLTSFRGKGPSWRFRCDGVTILSSSCRSTVFCLSTFRLCRVIRRAAFSTMSTALYTDRTPPDEHRRSYGDEDQSLHAEEEKGRLLDAAFSKDYLHASDRRPTKLPWIVASVTTILLLVSVIFNVLQWRTDGRCIFPTDLPDSRKAIEYEQRTFTGALVYDPDQQKMFRHQDAEVEYFGEPSQELEDAWSDMMRGALRRTGTTPLDILSSLAKKTPSRLQASSRR